MKKTETNKITFCGGNTNPKPLTIFEFERLDKKRFKHTLTTHDKIKLGTYWDGFGTYEHTNGSRYVGDFKDGYFHGKGKSFSGNGRMDFEGDWEDGLPNGKGIMIKENGETFEGDFVNGKPHGKTTFTVDPNDDYKYEGDYVNHMFEGKGTETFGDYKRGEVFDFIQYEGDFVNGFYHGFGTLTKSNGEKVDCFFDEGVLISSKNHNIVCNPKDI